MYATEELRVELEKTARKLAGRNLNLFWAEIDKFGLCGVRADNGQVDIILHPKKEFKDMYEIFLHEAGHALYIDLMFKDRRAAETAAHEQAFIWGICAGCLLPEDRDWRYPRDAQDLIERLKILRRFGRERHGYQSFLGKPIRTGVMDGLQQIIPWAKEIRWEELDSWARAKPR